MLNMFELRYSKERSTKFESLKQEWKYLEEQNGIIIALYVLPKLEDWVDRPQKGLYGILQLLLASHLDYFRLKTLKLDSVAFHSVKF